MPPTLPVHDDNPNMTGKIALALEHFQRYKGGAESFAFTLAAGLIRAGWEVHFYGLTWDGHPPEVVFHRINVPRWPPAFLKLLAFAREHRRAVRNHHFDVVLGFGNTIAMNVYQSHGGVHRVSTAKKRWAETGVLKRAAKGLLTGLSIKYHVRDWIESAPFRLEQRPRILAISDMIKQDISTTYHLRPEEVDVIYNGVDTARFNPQAVARFHGVIRHKFDLDPGTVLFLFVSHDLKKKGLGVLMEAAALLKQRGLGGFKILVVGGRPDWAFHRLTTRLKLRDTVIFAGPTDAPEEAYADGDVLVLPTYYDACSLVVIEAMACGLPPVTTTANGAAGLIQDGRSGFIISHPPRPPELADKLRLLLEPETRKAMSAEALKAGRRCSVDNALDKLSSIFEKVAGRS